MMSVITICLCFVVSLMASHIFFQRYVFPVLEIRSRQKGLVLLIGAHLIVFSLIPVFFGEADQSVIAIILQSIYIVIVSVCLGHVYFNWFNMSETARRIHLLVTYYKIVNQPSADTQSELKNYNSKNMIEVRLQRLIDYNAIKINNGKYYPNHGMILYGSIILAKIRKLFYR